ncbi:hypothetical protein NDU88_003534 [Pleurodeles waltl]|uniref:Uncharacterized protein n=1 Tax=Pleurodeles waltl TaxID=8319 RepID=A0AAV7Q978_PLEWA|nr:hypothetical protein NDU88_003534 [Pleurodeles waltl]
MLEAVVARGTAGSACFTQWLRPEMRLPSCVLLAGPAGGPLVSDRRRLCHRAGTPAVERRAARGEPGFARPAFCSSWLYCQLSGLLEGGSWPGGVTEDGDGAGPGPEPGPARLIQPIEVLWRGRFEDHQVEGMTTPWRPASKLCPIGLLPAT